VSWVLGSEVGFCGGFGWVLRLFLSPVLGHVLECLGLFLLRRLRGSFLGIVTLDLATIVLAPSGDGASLSSGLFDTIVGVESVVSRGVQCLSD
jgi:hypothetical protein